MVWDWTIMVATMVMHLQAWTVARQPREIDLRKLVRPRTAAVESYIITTEQHGYSSRRPARPMWSKSKTFTSTIFTSSNYSDHNSTQRRCYGPWNFECIM
jgi:hypothetical protein